MCWSRLEKRLDRVGVDRSLEVMTKFAPEIESSDRCRKARSTAEACEVLARLEDKNDVNEPCMGEIALWPLLRHVLWIELLRTGSVDGQQAPTALARLFSKTRKLSAVWYQKAVHPFLEK